MKRRFFLGAVAAAVVSPTSMLAAAKVPLPTPFPTPIVLHPGDDIQAAIDRCSRGCVVLLTAGVYKLGTPLIMPQSFTLLGDPKGRASVVYEDTRMWPGLLCDKDSEKVGMRLYHGLRA